MINSIKDIFSKVLKGDMSVTIDNISPDGDVTFIVSLEKLGLRPVDMVSPMVKTRFFVNFVGEILVRSNISMFADILTGFDPSLYEKIICNSKHEDFGMYLDRKSSLAKWQMHISLVQQILTEDYDRVMDGTPPSPSSPDESSEEE